MELRELNVLHWRGAHVVSRPVPDATPARGPDAFLIDTCQRRVAVTLSRESIEQLAQQFPADGALERFEGVEAYAFLVGFACGLESKLVAETEIFGQIKTAWQTFSERGSPLARGLSSCMQWIFQDAKTIRAQHLGNLGSASYGSQVRRLLGEGADAGPTLLIGAGQLAQSVAPWLGGSELWLWNRTPERARELARELEKRCPGRPVRVLESEAELEAWGQARNVVVCVPADAARDARRITAWREGAGQPRGQIIHLGLTVESAQWGEVPEMVSLGVLFDMLRSQSEVRRRAFERARRACMERALLRSLGASASHPHSWEDLAVFNHL